MPHFSPEFIERVRSSNDIIEGIGASLPLKRAGTNFVALCPFHSEKSPSFNVSPQRQIFHCFGCHAGGDIFGFIQKYENLSFVESVERLAERAQIPLEHETNPNAARQRGLKDQLLRLHEAICTRWQNCLANEAAGQVARATYENKPVGNNGRMTHSVPQRKYVSGIGRASSLSTSTYTPIASVMLLTAFS
jgi:DNA primase